MWLQIDTDLWTNRKILSLAAELELRPTYATAHLIRLWAWAIHQHDLSVAGMPAAAIATAADYPGDPDRFRQALVATGLLDEDGTIHDHDGRLAKVLAYRTWDRERKQFARARDRITSGIGVIHTVRGTSDGHPTDVRPLRTEKEENHHENETVEVVDLARALAQHDHNHHHRPISPVEHARLATLLQIWPQCKHDLDELAVLLHLTRMYPAVAWRHEAQRCRAHYKQAPRSWANAFSDWITQGRQILCADGNKYPGPDCNFELEPAHDPYHPDYQTEQHAGHQQ